MGLRKDSVVLGCLLLLLTATRISPTPNYTNQSMWLCGIDSGLSELLAEAGNRSFAKDERTAIQIYRNVLSIRPSCWDVHTTLALSYSVIGEKRLSAEHLKRGEALKAQWESQNPGPRKPAVLPTAEKKAKTLEPSRTDKINYWKWLFIYSALRRGRE